MNDSADIPGPTEPEVLAVISSFLPEDAERGFEQSVIGVSSKTKQTKSIMHTGYVSTPQKPNTAPQIHSDICRTHFWGKLQNKLVVKSDFYLK